MMVDFRAEAMHGMRSLTSELNFEICIIGLVKQKKAQIREPFH